LKIQFAISGGFIYYLGRVYRTHTRGGEVIVIEGDDWRVGYCVGLCDYLL